MGYTSSAFYINPSYVTVKPIYAKTGRSILQAMATEKMKAIRLAQRAGIKSNQGLAPSISKNTEKKIRLAVQWLVYLAKLKRVKSAVTGKEHDYRAGLLTLSLPSGCGDVSPKFFRDVLLSSMLDALRYEFQLKNYIWKLERQKRGALHAHITLDVYIPFDWVRSTWCKILDKNGCIDSYRDKFKSMSVRQYVGHRLLTDSAATKKRHSSHLQYIKSLVWAKQKGDRQKWSLPNCTDIHSVYRVRNLAAYLAKYIGKDPALGADFKGRFWSCSYSLSRIRSVKCEVDFRVEKVAMDDISKISDSHLEMMKVNRENTDVIWLGCIFYLKRKRFNLHASQIYSQVMAFVSRIYHGLKDFEPPVFEWDPTYGTQAVIY